jgi:hypothetical protein
LKERKKKKEQKANEGGGLDMGAILGMAKNMLPMFMNKPMF